MKARTWCRAHYLRWYKTGDPLVIRPARWDGYERPRCSVEGCEQPAHARGLCTVHGPRMRRHGNPTDGRRLIVPGGDAERFWTFVEQRDGCLLWLGATTSAGYPEFQVDGRTVYAHRWSYEYHVGPIPEGHDLHHECETPACVDWTHLVPLTKAAHRRRHKEMKR